MLGVAAMDDEVELISDGDGLAVIGNPTAVERFIASVGLSANLRSPRLGAVFTGAASIAQTGGSPVVFVGQFRPGSGGQQPPRVSMAMAMSASGEWKP